MQESAVQRLSELVTASRDVPLCHGACALARAWRMLDKPPGVLTELAVGLGFTKTEAEAIMDGWDTSAGGTGCWASNASQPGYSEGFELGQKLFALVVQA